MDFIVVSLQITETSGRTRAALARLIFAARLANSATTTLNHRRRLDSSLCCKVPGLVMETAANDVLGFLGIAWRRRWDRQPRNVYVSSSVHSLIDTKQIKQRLRRADSLSRAAVKVSWPVCAPRLRTVLASSTNSRLCIWQILAVFDESRWQLTSSLARAVFLEYLDGRNERMHLYLVSSKSLISQSSTSSAIVKTYVLNTILSYHTPAAARAFACHGPRPPSLACCLLSQKPEIMSVVFLRIERLTYKSPGSADFGLLLHTNISTVLHWPWLPDARKHLVQTIAPGQHQVSPSSSRVGWNIVKAFAKSWLEVSYLSRSRRCGVEVYGDTTRSDSLFNSVSSVVATSFRSSNRRCGEVFENGDVVKFQAPMLREEVLYFFADTRHQLRIGTSVENNAAVYSDRVVPVTFNIDVGISIAMNLFFYVTE
ncbi:hypothetical protein KCU62_g491, partial [Aureobasidium sp. EXF-3399]